MARANPRRSKFVSCGVVVTDGERILLGHATRSPRWDIPKGVAEAGESHAVAAARELAEETGLTVAPDELTSFGLHEYLPGKDLALFAWYPPELPDPAELECSSYVTIGTQFLPEFDRFGLFGWDEGLSLVGKNMSRVLAALRPALIDAAPRRVAPRAL